MMDKELLKHCLYYKGQEICPVEWKGTVYEHYWGLEAAYTRLPEDSRARYKKYGNDKFHKDFPELVGVIEKLSEEERGILAYIVDYTFYMQPYTNTTLFLDYGKNRQAEHVEAVPPKVVTKSPLLYYKGENQNPYKLTDSYLIERVYVRPILSYRRNEVWLPQMVQSLRGQRRRTTKITQASCRKE